MKYNHLFAINCDWLQLHVKAGTDFLEREQAYYSFQRKGQSKIFKNIYDVIQTTTKVVVGQYCTDANECVMRPGYGVLKIENNQLYCCDDLQTFTQILLDRLGFKFISITRLDIAMDFQKFFLNRNPQTLIREYAAHKVAHVGGSRKVNSIMFKQHNRFHDFQSMYLGSRKADVTVRMYNKSEELKNNFKPWIDFQHKQIFANTPGDIWRIEFSIYSLSKALLQKANGETINYNSLDILQLKNLYGIYQGLFDKYFKFRVCGKAKRIARMKPLQLWNFDATFLRMDLKKISPLIKASSRKERSFLLHLNKMYNEARDRNLKVKLRQCIKYCMHIFKCNTCEKGDLAEKICIKKIRKFVADKQFDERMQDTSKELIGKMISEFQLHDFAALHKIEYAGYENYIFQVQEFRSIEANKEKLDQESKLAIAAANEVFINDLSLELPCNF